MNGYSFALANDVTLAEEQLLTLHQKCFSHYEGVLPFDRPILSWYLSRPGLGLNHTLVMIFQGEIVSSLFLTLTKMYFAKEIVPVGIIDTVMTHPQHRNKGLASRLLKEAEAIMEKRGCIFGYLYTIPDTPQFRLYQKLGYQPFRQIYHFQASAPIYPSPESTFSPIYPEEQKLQAFLNQTFASYDGFIPLDSAQWKWRKKERPYSLPAKLLATGITEIEATITQTPGKIIIRGKEEQAFFLSDWAGRSPQSKTEVLLLALSSSKGKIDILCPQVNQEDWQLLKQIGLSPTLPEQAMLYPLTSHGKTLMNQSEGNLWYPLVESMVGI